MRRAVLAALAVLALGCSRKPSCESAADGCLVVFSYRTTVDDKAVDGASPEAPAETRLGAGGLVPGLEEALRGMKAGEKKTFAVPPEKGFGVRNEAAVQDLPIAIFKSVGKLKPGMSVQGVSDGAPASGRVIAVTSSTVRLDFNHELAGKILLYEVGVLRVTP